MTQDRKETGLSDELLQRYFDEELTAVERVDVEARLDASARLRLDAMSELRMLLRVRTNAAASGVSLSSAIDVIERAPVTTTPTSPTRRRWLPLSAVGGFLAAAAAVLFFMRPVDRLPTNEANVEMLEVQGAVATVFRIEDHGDPTRTATVIWSDEDESGTNDPSQGKVTE